MNTSLVRGLARLNQWTHDAVSWGTLGMVLLTFTVVLLRYALGVGFIWMQEAVLYLHSIVFLLAAGATLDSHGHVRVDIFYRNASPTHQARVDLLGSVFFLLPVCGLILWQAFPFVLASWMVRETSQEPGGLPGVFLLKTLLLLYAVLLLASGARLILSSLRTLLSGTKS